MLSLNHPHHQLFLGYEILLLTERRRIQMFAFYVDPNAGYFVFITNYNVLKQVDQYNIHFVFEANYNPLKLVF